MLAVKKLEIIKVLILLSTEFWFGIWDRQDKQTVRWTEKQLDKQNQRQVINSLTPGRNSYLSRSQYWHSISSIASSLTLVRRQNPTAANLWTILKKNRGSGSTSYIRALTQKDPGKFKHRTNRDWFHHKKGKDCTWDRIISSINQNWGPTDWALSIVGRTWMLQESVSQQGSSITKVEKVATHWKSLIQKINSSSSISSSISKMRLCLKYGVQFWACCSSWILRNWKESIGVIKTANGMWHRRNSTGKWDWLFCQRRLTGNLIPPYNCLNRCFKVIELNSSL